MSFGSKSTKPWDDYISRSKAMGCIVTRADNEDVLNYHHLMGVTKKHNKQLIGPWIGIPLLQMAWGTHPDNLHEYGPKALHTNKRAFESFAGNTEHELCLKHLYKFIEVYNLSCDPDPLIHDCPWTYEEWLAIEDYLK